MTTDDERREVAARLRELRPNACFDDVYEALGAYGPSPYESRCLSATGFARHLADLIEPATADAERSANVQRTFGNEGERSDCDRDALLAPAEEMVEAFRLGAFTGEGLDAKWCRELHDKYARRIREALGVVA